MTTALETLRTAAERFADSALGRHALVTLARPLMRDQMVLRIPEGGGRMASVAADGGRFETAAARPDEARRMLEKALLDDRSAATATFGELTHGVYLEMYSTWLEECGEAAASAAPGPAPAQPPGAGRLLA